MIGLQSNNLINAQTWQPPDWLRELPVANPGSFGLLKPFYQDYAPYATGSINFTTYTYDILINGQLIEPAPVDATPPEWTDVKYEIGSHYLLSPIANNNEDKLRAGGLPDYQKEIEVLPVVKRAQLEKALKQIKGYLVDIEMSEDGEIIIETKEDGADCFYAICTRNGDFKGTWLPDGSLLRKPWSANLHFEAHFLSLTLLVATSIEAEAR